MGGRGLGRVGDRWEWGYLEGVQPSGVWASSSAVEMWGDRFLLFLELGREKRGKCSPPRNQFLSKEASFFLIPSPAQCRGCLM